MHQFAAGTPTCACARPINPTDFDLTEVAPADLPRMVKLVAGRMPSQNSPDEVLASFRLQQDIGVGVGTVIRVPLYSAAQQGAYLSGAAVTPAGGTVTLRVVGIEAAEAEFPFAATPSYTVYTTTAFARLHAGRTAGVAFSFVRLRGGAAAFPRFEAEARAAGAFSVSDADTAVGSIGTSIWPQVLGWWLLAGLTALAGMVVLAQALSRQAEADAEPFSTYRALGATWRQVAAVGMIATLLVAVAGAGIGTGLAVLLSPLTPVGLARIAELSSGFTFDTVVLAPGAGVAVLAVLALGTWPTVRTARRAARGDGDAARGLQAVADRDAAGQCRGAAERAHRSQARPGTRPRAGRRPGADRAARVGARRDGAVGGGGVRRQPRASDQHARPLRAVVRRVVLAEWLKPGQRSPVLCARDHPGA